MEREDGHTFDCRIPPFSLESKPDEGPPTPPDSTEPPEVPDSTATSAGAAV